LCFVYISIIDYWFTVSYGDYTTVSKTSPENIFVNSFTTASRLSCLWWLPARAPSHTWGSWNRPKTWR